MVPVELKLAHDRRCLSVTWENGDVSHLPAELLRRQSRSASAVRAAFDGREPVTDDVTLEAIEPIGSYAVRLSFSDGHDRGIFPWVYLHEIAVAA